MLNPMRDKNGRQVPEGERDDTCYHCLSRRSLRVVQTVAEGKTSYELSWKINVVM